MGDRKHVESEIARLCRDRKKMVVLQERCSERETLHAFAFPPAKPGTCVSCGFFRERGIMVCEKHRRLRELRAELGPKTLDDVRSAIADVDRRVAAYGRRLGTSRQVVKMSDDAVSYHERSDNHADKYEDRNRWRCNHCKSDWSEEEPCAECPQCGDRDITRKWAKAYFNK